MIRTLNSPVILHLRTCIIRIKPHRNKIRFARIATLHGPKNTADGLLHCQRNIDAKSRTHKSAQQQHLKKQWQLHIFPELQARHRL